jgi:putative endonuclease
MRFYYVYILMSVNEPERHYIGFTTDLKQRLDKHNSGQVPHTSKYSHGNMKLLYLFLQKQKL